MPNLILKTVMDNKELKRGIKETEKEIENLKKAHQKASEESRKELEKLEQEYQKTKEEETKLGGYKKWKKTKTKEYKEQGYNDEQIKTAIEWDAESEGWGDVNSKAQEISDKLEEIKQKKQEIIASDEKISEENANQLIELERQKQAAEEMIQKKEEIANKEKQVKNALKDTNNKMTGIIKKVIRWSVALIGIRSIYGMLSQAASTVTRYNTELAQKLESIKFTLAMSLAPVIEKIINFLYKMVQYVQWLVYKTTGYDLFKSAEENLANANAQANKLKKSLAGFDTANVLNDNTDSSASEIKSMGKLTDDEVPKWLQKVADAINWVKEKVEALYEWITKGGWKTIALAILGIVAALIILKVILKSLTSMDLLGFAIVVAGVVATIMALANIMELLTADAEKTNAAVEAFMLIVIAVVALMAAMTLAAEALQSPLAMAGLALIVGAVVALLLVMEETLPTILNAVGDFIEKIGPTLIKILETIGKAISDIIYALGTVLPPIIREVGNLFEKIFNGIAKVIKTVGKVITDIMKTAKNLITDVLDKIIEFINRLGPAINNFVDGVITAVTKLINFIVSGVEYLINTLIVDAINGLLKAVKNNKIVELLGLDGNITLLSRVNISRFTPKLATGGIINNPGPGIPIGGAIAGEAGREGVIPLTDSQAMAEIGKEIGKWITVNVDLTTRLDSRVLSRSLEKVQQQNSFIRNGV